MNTGEKVCEIIGSVLAPYGQKAPEIKPEHRIGMDGEFGPDLGEDSLDRVEIVMQLEDELNLEIPDEDAEKWKTVADVIAYVDAKKGGEG